MILLFQMINLSPNQAESLNEYFINVGINIGTESEQLYEISSDDQIPESGLDHSPNIRFKFANINVSTVAMNLRNLKASKTTGMNNLPAKILKISSYLIAPLLILLPFLICLLLNLVYIYIYR